MSTDDVDEFLARVFPEPDRSESMRLHPSNDRRADAPAGTPHSVPPAEWGESSAMSTRTRITLLFVTAVLLIIAWRLGLGCAEKGCPQ